MLYMQEGMGHALVMTEWLYCGTGFTPTHDTWGGSQDPHGNLTYLHLLCSIVAVFVEHLDILEVQEK